MNDVIMSLFETIEERKKNPAEGSYTAYLFEKGLDKILKKVAEECGETIIAAKNGEKEPLIAEVADLAFHLCVMLSALGVSPLEVEAELASRAQKPCNLKQMKTVDKNS